MKKKKQSKKIEDLAVENFYYYIQEKAKIYLRIGPEKHRLGDAFKQPDAGLTEDELQVLREGCKMVLDFRGLTPETAFTGLNIPGFYNLMRMFHFKPSMQQIHQMGDGWIIDEMHMEHMVSGVKMRLYNKVETSSYLE